MNLASQIRFNQLYHFSNNTIKLYFFYQNEQVVTIKCFYNISTLYCRPVSNNLIVCFIFILDSVSDQESSIIIRTEAKPISGNCQLIPASGMAGKTLFNLTCSKYLDSDVLSYYYYEWYKNVNDRSELSNKINNFIRIVIITIVIKKLFMLIFNKLLVFNVCYDPKLNILYILIIYC